MNRFVYAAAIAAVLLPLCASRASAQATASCTATVSSPGDNTTHYTSLHTYGTPPYTQSVRHADVPCTTTHNWQITGANPNEQFAVSYSATLTADYVERSRFVRPAPPYQTVPVSAKASGIWEAETTTLSYTFQPGAGSTGTAYYDIEAYSEISTSTIAGDASSDVNTIIVKDPS